MANVSNRGQVILVTGFALAVTLVAVVLLLNTVIYTENIATRGTDPSPAEALEFRDVAIDGIGELVVATNQDGYDDPAKVDANVTAAVTNLSEYLQDAHMPRASIATINTSSLSLTDGVLLRQSNDSRSFTSGGSTPGNTTWNLAENVDSSRRMRIFVERSSLATEDLLDLLSNDVFAVRLVGATNNWTVYIYENPAGNIALGTSTNGGNEEFHCEIDADNATIDLTGEGIVGADCTSFTWAAGVSAPYDIWFLHGDQAIGHYNLTIKGSSPEIDSNFNSSGDTDPVALEAVYSATVEIRYQTPSLIYDAEIRVAPGEADA